MSAWTPPLFYRDDFDRLWGEPPPERSSPEFARELLVAHGRCLVHEAAADTLPSLPPEVATSGGKRLAEEVEATAADVEGAIARWDDADGSPEADDIVAGLLEFRMESWYGAESLDATAQRPEAGDAAATELALARLDVAVRSFDLRLEKHLDVLSTAAGTPLLCNWRAMLPERHQWLPWWLDGTLEAAGLKLAREADVRPGPVRNRGEMVPRSVVLNRCDDMPLRRSAAALAAEAPGRGMRTIGWHLPGSSLRVTMYVPPRIAAGDRLLLEMEDAAGGDSVWRAVGTIFFLNAVPLCWRLGAGESRAAVASWGWSGLSQLADDQRLSLVDGATGIEWERTDTQGG